MRVLRYIKVTLHLTLILRSNILSDNKWWVDESFVIYPECKGNTVSMMSMGSGSIMEILRNYKKNGRISTEADIGAGNSLP